ncbi:hypothetical protein MXL58_21750 [Enterobacter quasiroggenkampii]|uniref:hypothetical protein n=1 Tax=Enterobacter quasiroggenkampii TaxID=2497436 RepID=UPI002DBD9B23|nr:hypothetical protein [Enterobacter quasiroggenkampii]MEB6579754.1 hypothetical protein [Enterobacter quasiroggenkampii]
MLEVIRSQTNIIDDSDYIVSMLITENSTSNYLTERHNEDVHNEIMTSGTSRVRNEIEKNIALISNTHVVVSVNSNVLSNYLYSSSVYTRNTPSYFLELTLPQTNLGDWKSNSLYKEAQQKEKIRKILACVKQIEQENEREASRFLMKTIEGSLKYRELTFINELLSLLRTYNMNHRFLVCALRSTFRAKSKLPVWEVTLSYTKKSIVEKGLSSKSWLVGLCNE